MPNTIRHNRYQSDPYATEGNYVHRNGPGSFTAYRDGWVQHDTPERTYSAAARHLFNHCNAGGYPIAYYPFDEQGHDICGDVLCADCAAAEWIADPSARFLEELCEEQLERDVICDNCNTIIAPQQCRLCFDSIHEEPYANESQHNLPVFWGEYYVAHGHCIAEAMTKTPGPYDKPKPVKVGKGQYRVPGAGNQIMTAEGAR